MREKIAIGETLLAEDDRGRIGHRACHIGKALLQRSERRLGRCRVKQRERQRQRYGNASSAVSTSRTTHSAKAVMHCAIACICAPEKAPLSN
jgi:hypothetical protein